MDNYQHLHLFTALWQDVLGHKLSLTPRNFNDTIFRTQRTCAMHSTTSAIQSQLCRPLFWSLTKKCKRNFNFWQFFSLVLMLIAYDDDDDVDLHYMHIHWTNTDKKSRTIKIIIKINAVYCTQLLCVLTFFKKLTKLRIVN